MPELDWDEHDVLYCLEVVPECDEYFTSYAYDVQRDGSRLLVTIYPLESVVALTLWAGQMETPLFDGALYVRGKVQYLKDKQGEYLEFQDSVITPHRFWYGKAGDVFNHERFAVGVEVQIRIKPSISLKLV
jgi:hypothetical protein